MVPWTRFVLAEEVAERLESRLPPARYPALRARREVYPHLRKLTDLHDASAWSMVLDSDMLFFRRPDALLAWMDAPHDALFIEDAIRSYGYSDALMNELARGPVPDRMNVGLYGLHGSAVDYDYLEHCCSVTIERGARKLRPGAGADGAASVWHALAGPSRGGLQGTPRRHRRSRSDCSVAPLRSSFEAELFSTRVATFRAEIRGGTMNSERPINERASVFVGWLETFSNRAAGANVLSE